MTHSKVTLMIVTTRPVSAASTPLVTAPARAAVLAALGLFASAWLAPPPAAASKSGTVKVDGYLEYRKAGALIVDAQRVRTDAKTKLKGSGKAKSIATIPLGYEIQVKGTRGPDGSVLAREIVARPNEKAFMEDDVLKGTTQAEQAYVKARKVYDKGPDGAEKSIGELITTGPQVDRARGIVDRLLPDYIDPKSVRVYVVDNKEWN